MVVLGRIGVEAGLAAGVFQLFNHPHAGQQIQVAVDRAQTHLWQPTPDELVKLTRRRVRSHRSQLFQNNLPLPRIAVLALAGARKPIATRL